MQSALVCLRQLSLAYAETDGFTDEELDFIINYDIKYRLGAEEGD